MSYANHAAKGYRAEVDRVNSTEWAALLNRFVDGNIYQTWPYEAAVHPRLRVSRMVLYENDVPVGLVQAGLILAPIVGGGMAYIRWGPVWRLRGEEEDRERFRFCLEAIVEEYARRRKLVVRIVTGLNATDEGWARAVFAESGFHLHQQPCPQRTIIVDLSPSLPAIQAGLHGKWRNCLNSGRKKEHELTERTDDDAFAEFSGIYLAMRARKNFETTTSFEAFRNMQGNLEGRAKLIVILCGAQGQWHSGAVISRLGDRGIYLFGATAGSGLQSNGSYLVQWRAIELLKEIGCREYDLNGINPETNPTTYHFKSRLAGTNGRDVTSLGTFEASLFLPGRLAVRVGMKCVDLVRAGRRKLSRAAAKS